MSQPRFFVIGATGYIGVPLVRLLSSFGYDVRGLARSGDKATLLGLDGILPVMGTLDNPESWIGAASEAEFLIDVSQNNSDREGHAAKVERAANLWAETRKRQGKPKGYFLYTSGTGVHGDLYERLKRPLSEADTPTPPKFVAFRPALEQRIINSSEWVGYVIRPGFVYGRKGSYSGTLIASLSRGSNEPVSMPVSPDQQTPTIHVEDLVHAYLAVVERRDDPAVKGQIFNIVNPIPERRKDMIDAVVRFTGFKGTITYREPATPQEIFSAYSSVFDTTKARTVLGWYPRHPAFAAAMDRWGRSYASYL